MSARSKTRLTASALFASAICAGLCLAPATSNAALTNFYAFTNPGTVARLTPTYDFGSITAAAGQTTPGTVQSLTVSNFGDDLGLGVCGSSDEGSLCTLGGDLQQLNLSTSQWTGDITEIDNAKDDEFLTLTANRGRTLTGQFLLGSLDSNGDGSFEDGYVSFGENTVRFTRTASGASITQGSATIEQAAGYPSNVFLLTLTDLNQAITEVRFGAGGSTDSATNNDYLVAAAYTGVVPLPGAAWLFGTGLAGVIARARRRKAAA